MHPTECTWPLYTLVQSPNSVTQQRTVWSADDENNRRFTTCQKNKIKIDSKKAVLENNGFKVLCSTLFGHFAGIHD